MINSNTRAFALGVVCGMRTMLGPALLAKNAPANARLAFWLLSWGEIIGDKLPKTPSRIAPGPFLGRLVSGAGVGYVVFREAEQSPWAGAALGAVGALVGSYGGYYLRKALGRKLGVPDPIIALLEDLLAANIGQRFNP